MREELEARPSAIFFVALVLGLVCSTALIACLAALGLAIMVRGLPRKWVVALGFLIGIVLSPHVPERLVEPKFIEGTATVTSVPAVFEDRQTCEVQVKDTVLLATLPASPPVMIWDQFRLSGNAKPIGSQRPTFDPVIGSIRVQSLGEVRKGPWIVQVADGWRRSFFDFLSRSLPAEEAALADAICFSGRSMLDLKTRGDLASSGLIHLVSVSGVQVFALAALVFLGLRLLPISRASQLLVLCIVLTLYGIAAGMQPQIVRATAMVLLGYSSYIFSRDPDPVSALCLSGTGVLLWRPETVFGLGFQLSFLVALGFAFYFHSHPALKTDWKTLIRRRLAEFTSASLVVVFAAYPLVAYAIGVISPGGLVANLLVFWTVPMIVGASFVSHGLSVLSPILGEGAATVILSPLCDWVLNISHLASFPFASVAVPGFSGYWLAIYYGGWALVYRRRIVHP